MKLQSVLVAICLVVAVAIISTLIPLKSSAQQRVLSDQVDQTLNLQGLDSSTTLSPVPSVNTHQPQPLLLGRYQMQMQLVQNSTSPIIIVCDTTTGQCWQKNTMSTAGWDDIGSPYTESSSGITSR